MHIRPATIADLAMLAEIDATIESSEYLHVERAGEGLSMSISVQVRPAREKANIANRLHGDIAFDYRQIAGGNDEGISLIAEHDQVIVAACVAAKRPAANLLELRDVRVDFDQRREGVATAMLFSIAQTAREWNCRAVFAESLANNVPVAQMLLKCGFDVAGVDTRRQSNHDLARELSTLLWYAALD